MRRLPAASRATTTATTASDRERTSRRCAARVRRSETRRDLPPASVNCLRAIVVFPRRSRRSMRHRCSAAGQRTRKASERRRDTRTRRGRYAHPRRGLILRRPGRRRRRGSAARRRRRTRQAADSLAWPSLQIPAVVDRAAADGDLAADGRRPRVAPALASRGCRMPGRSAVHGDLDAADPPAATVSGGAADGDGLPGHDGQRSCRGGRDRRSRIGRGRGHSQAGLHRRRLDAHVGEQVDRGLLHRNARGRAVAVVLVVEPPRPLHSAWRRTPTLQLAWRVKRQVVFGRTPAVVRPVIEQHRGVRNRRAR